MPVYHIIKELGDIIIANTLTLCNFLIKFQISWRFTAEKFMIKSEKQNLRNRSIRSEIRTLAKKVEAEIDLKSQETAKLALKLFEKKGMSSVSKGVFHINTVARRISRLYARIKSINA